ncbi:DUF3592 domain-containing protein [Colwellia sp. MEBiC06753]
MTTSILNIVIALVIIVALYLLFQLKNSGQWLQTQATITELAITENFNRNNSTNRNSVEHHVDIRFNYSVAGNSYQGTKIYPSLPNVFTDQNDLARFTEQYQQGMQTTVYYNPNDPKQSALVKVQLSNVAFLVLALIILLVAGIIYWVINKLIA